MQVNIARISFSPMFLPQTYSLYNQQLTSLEHQLLVNSWSCERLSGCVPMIFEPEGHVLVASRAGHQDLRSNKERSQSRTCHRK